MSLLRLSVTSAAIALITATSVAHGHGNVAPQAVDTDALPDLGEEWLTENPYRNAGPDVWQQAIEIGASAYLQNCARCHGLEGISGGLAPDLRILEAEEYGDEWYVERFRNGYTQDGVTKMPGYEDILGQKAAWAIRTYLETRPDDVMMAEQNPELKEIRDQLAHWADKGQVSDDADAVKLQLAQIAEEIETLSGAPMADSIAFRAANEIDGTAASYRAAAEILTIGLSVTD